MARNENEKGAVAVIEHMVLFKVKPETPPAAVDAMLEGLRGLKSSSPQIVELTCGANSSARSQGYTHGLFVRFRSRADLEAYAVDPAHQRVVAERIRPITEGILVVDYEA
jgi:hypothetical protein